MGYKGQTSWTTCGQDIYKAKGVFESSLNQWDERDNLLFDLVKMYYLASSSNVDEVYSIVPIKKESGPAPESSLAKSVQELFSLIFNIQTMEQGDMEMEYDTKKAPLG